MVNGNGRGDVHRISQPGTGGPDQVTRYLAHPPMETCGAGLSGFLHGLFSVRHSGRPYPHRPNKRVMRRPFSLSP